MDRGRHRKDARPSKCGTIRENRKVTALVWPGGKRIAIAIAVMYEAWSEGKAPQYSVQTTSLRPEMVNLSGITWAEYGGGGGGGWVITTPPPPRSKKKNRARGGGG